mmetsp:Transcript_32936/g.81871  ORF Transcript_32936/g.81871 Transcript_32936/m.81871 type:complete len:303 (-) Transcript_32936:485-1393(-)
MVSAVTGIPAARAQRTKYQRSGRFTCPSRQSASASMRSVRTRPRTSSAGSTRFWKAAVSSSGASGRGHPPTRPATGTRPHRHSRCSSRAAAFGCTLPAAALNPKPGSGSWTRCTLWKMLAATARTTAARWLRESRRGSLGSSPSAASTARAGPIVRAVHSAMTAFAFWTLKSTQNGMAASGSASRVRPRPRNRELSRTSTRFELVPLAALKTWLYPRLATCFTCVEREMANCAPVRASDAERGPEATRERPSRAATARPGSLPRLDRASGGAPSAVERTRDWIAWRTSGRSGSPSARETRTA